MIFIVNTANIIPIDSETGEIVSEVIITTFENEQLKKEYFKQREKVKMQREVDSELGHFIFNLFSEVKNLENLKPQTAARMMYLSTYLGYDNNQLMTTERKAMTKSSLKSIMNLKKSTFASFYKEITDNGYLTEIDGSLYLNKHYFYRGELSKKFNPTKTYRFTRIYINALRELYVATRQSSHVYLGYVFQLLPYINLEWNIVCKNPLEQSRYAIKPMTIGEFCDKIGYDKTQASRLISAFCNLLFNWKGKEQKFCTFIYESNKTDMKIFCNPNVFYAGSRWKEVEVLGVFF